MHTSHRLVHAWFLEVISSANVCLCVCVCTPKAINNYSVILTLNDWLNNFSCFSVPFMALAVDVINRRGHGNEMHRRLQPKKTEV